MAHVREGVEPLALAERLHGCAVDEHRSAVGGQLPGQHARQGRLAAAALSDDGEKRVAGYREVDAVEDRSAGTRSGGEPLTEADPLRDDRRRQRPLPGGRGVLRAEGASGRQIGAEIQGAPDRCARSLKAHVTRPQLLDRFGEGDVVAHECQEHSSRDEAAEYEERADEVQHRPSGELVHRASHRFRAPEIELRCAHRVLHQFVLPPHGIQLSAFELQCLRLSPAPDRLVQPVVEASHRRSLPGPYALGALGEEAYGERHDHGTQPG